MALIHKPGCVLDPVHWLRHAAAAAGWLVSDGHVDESVDKVAARLLIDSIAHLAELPEWAIVTLNDLALHAASGLPEPDRFADMCTCAATDEPA